MAASADASLAVIEAAFAVHRRDTDKGSNLLAIKFTALRQLAEQGIGEDSSDTGDAGQDLRFCAPVLDLHDGFVDLFGDCVDLSFERLKKAFDRAMQGFGMGLIAGCIVAAKRAMTKASILSVLASTQMAWL